MPAQVSMRCRAAPSTMTSAASTRAIAIPSQRWKSGSSARGTIGGRFVVRVRIWRSYSSTAPRAIPTTTAAASTP